MLSNCLEISNLKTTNIYYRSTIKNALRRIFKIVCYEHTLLVHTLLVHWSGIISST